MRYGHSKRRLYLPHIHHYRARSTHLGARRELILLLWFTFKFYYWFHPNRLIIYLCSQLSLELFPIYYLLLMSVNFIYWDCHNLAFKSAAVLCARCAWKSSKLCKHCSRAFFVKGHFWTEKYSKWDKAVSTSHTRPFELQSVPSAVPLNRGNMHWAGLNASSVGEMMKWTEASGAHILWICDSDGNRPEFQSPEA